MAVTPVSLGPALRAWSLAGVTHLLCDEPVDAGLAGQDTAQSPRQEERILPATPLSVSSPQSVVSIAGTSAGFTPADGKDGGRSGRHHPQAGGPLVFPNSDGIPQDPKDWPSPWGARLAKSVRAPILWTYHELGADLLGTGEPERSAFFKSLIGDLRLPKGSSVFWPCAMPAPGRNDTVRMEANPALYAAGVRRLTPRVMVVLGNRAVADMGLAGRITLFRQEMVEGCLLLPLPDINDLLRQQGQRQSAVSLLRAVLASVNFP